MDKTAAGSVWENRVFKRIFAAYTVSTFGDWVDHIAIIMLFGYVWRANPVLIALIPVTSALPGVLLGQLAGVWADRFDKLKLMVYSDLISAVLTFVMAISLNPFLVLALLFLRNAAGSLNLPAQQSLTKLILPEGHLLKATALNGMLMQLAKILGPVLGASFAAISSPSLCIFVNSLSFLASALVLLSSGKTQEHKSASKSKANMSLFDSWADGWKTVINSKVLLYYLGFACVVLTIIQMVDSQFVVLLREKAPETPLLAGWLMSAFGFGAFSAIFVLNKRKTVTSYNPLLGASVVLMGICFALLGALPAGTPVYWLPLSALIGGAGTGLAGVGINYLLLKETPQEALGRVMGIYTSLTNGIFVVSPLIGGLIISGVGAGNVFRVIGIALIVMGLGMYTLGSVVVRKALMNGSAQ